MACNITAGIGIIGCATNMMKEIFGTHLPHIVTETFAANFVVGIAVISIIGRIGWASFSDILGRKNTFYLFFLCGIPLYLMVPYTADMVAQNPSATPLIMFYCSTMLLFSMYGGCFATLPAYLADLFGTKYVGGIHGRVLTAWSVAGVIGPQVMTYLRKQSSDNALLDLTSKVDPLLFEQKFGAPISNIQLLADTKTVTICNLMEIMPAGTVDPTPYLYDTTMYSMASLLVIAALANSQITPVDPKYHMIEGPPAAEHTTSAAQPVTIDVEAKEKVMEDPWDPKTQK
jgi:hypothetical protein